MCFIFCCNFLIWFRFRKVKMVISNSFFKVGIKIIYSINEVITVCSSLISLERQILWHHYKSTLAIIRGRAPEFFFFLGGGESEKLPFWGESEKLTTFRGEYNVFSNFRGGICQRVTLRKGGNIFPKIFGGGYPSQLPPSAHVCLNNLHI